MALKSRTEGPAVGLHPRVWSWGSRRALILAVGPRRLKVTWRLKNGRVLTHDLRPTQLDGLPVGELDALTRSLTAMGSFRELIEAAGGYRPTILPRDASYMLLAVEYDRAQHRRKDPRRAFTGGSFCTGVPSHERAYGC